MSAPSGPVKLLNFLGLAGTLFLAGCGLKLGGGQPINDAPPSGGVIAYQGSFNSGAQVSGTVTVYATTSGYVVALTLNSAPSSPQLYIRGLLSPSSFTSRIQLISLNGTRNYLFSGIFYPETWQRVDLVDVSGNTSYGQAVLTSVNPNTPPQ